MEMIFPTTSSFIFNRCSSENPDPTEQFIVPLEQTNAPKQDSYLVPEFPYSYPITLRTTAFTLPSL